MSSKLERRRARQNVAAYHEAELSALVAHVGEAIDKFRAGELDAFDVDQVLLQYARAAKALWKFCNLGDVEITARFVHEGPPKNWWQGAAPTPR